AVTSRCSFCDAARGVLRMQSRLPSPRHCQSLPSGFCRIPACEVGGIHAEVLVLLRRGSPDFDVNSLEGIGQFEADLCQVLRVGFDLRCVLGDDDVTADKLDVDFRRQVPQRITGENRGWSRGGRGHGVSIGRKGTPCYAYNGCDGATIVKTRSPCARSSRAMPE